MSLEGSCFKHWDQDTIVLVFSVRENYDFAAWGSSWGAGCWWSTPGVLALWHGAQAGLWHGRDSSQLFSETEQGASAVLLEHNTGKEQSHPGPSWGAISTEGKANASHQAPISTNVIREATSPAGCWMLGQGQQWGRDSGKRGRMITEGEGSGKDGQQALCALR